MFAPLVVCDAEGPEPAAQDNAPGRDIRTAVRGAIHLDADTPAMRIAEIARAVGSLP